MCSEHNTKIGLLLLGCERFRTLGETSSEGSYDVRVQQRAKKIASKLSATMDVVSNGVVYDREQCREAIAAFQAMRVDMVVVMFLSWVPDRVWNQFLRDMPEIPILYAHVTNDVSLGDTHEDGEFVRFLTNAGLVGVLECSGDISRYARPMLFRVNGPWDTVLQRIHTLGAAARIRSMLKEAHFGLMDSYNEVMWSTYVDPYSLFMNVGPELHFLSIAEWAQKIKEIPLSQADEYTRRLEQSYEVLEGVDRDKLVASVRATLGMEKQAREHQLDVLVYNDVDTTMLEIIGLRPGFYPLSKEGKRCLIVPEGDIGSGIALYVLAHLGNGHVNYMEPFYVDPALDAIVVGHAGPNDYTNPDGTMKISRDVRFERTTYRYAGAPFAWYVFPEGRKTLLHCSQKNGRFQFVVTQVDFLPCKHFLATYCHGRFRPVTMDCETFIAKLTQIGVTQHYLSTDGDQRSKIKDLAELLDFDYIEL